MRAGVEGAFSSLLVVEATTDQAAEDAQRKVDELIHCVYGRQLANDVGQYRFIYALHPFDNPAVRDIDGGNHFST